MRMHARGMVRHSDSVWNTVSSEGGCTRSELSRCVISMPGGARGCAWGAAAVRAWGAWGAAVRACVRAGAAAKVSERLLSLVRMVIRQKSEPIGLGRHACSSSLHACMRGGGGLPAPCPMQHAGRSVRSSRAAAAGVAWRGVAGVGQVAACSGEGGACRALRPRQAHGAQGAGRRAVGQAAGRRAQGAGQRAEGGAVHATCSRLTSRGRGRGGAGGCRVEDGASWCAAPGLWECNALAHAAFVHQWHQWLLHSWNCVPWAGRAQLLVLSPAAAAPPHGQQQPPARPALTRPARLRARACPGPREP